MCSYPILGAMHYLEHQLLSQYQIVGGAAVASLIFANIKIVLLERWHHYLCV